MRVRLGQVALVLVSIAATVAVYQVWSAAVELWSALDGVALERPEPAPPRTGGADEGAAEAPAPAPRRPAIAGAESIRLAPPSVPDADAVGPTPTRTPPPGSMREARARWREGLSDEAREALRERRRENRLSRGSDERAVRSGAEVRVREGGVHEGAPGELSTRPSPHVSDTD